jgi:hypothetical protein
MHGCRGAPITDPAVRGFLPPHQEHLAGIIASLTHCLSNGPTESVSTKIRLLTRIAYGFSSTNNLSALGRLDRGGRCPPLPAQEPAP